MAAVHHGGASTTAASLRAGVPSIIVPFFADQPAWGQRLADLGVSPYQCRTKNCHQSDCQQLSRSL